MCENKASDVTDHSYGKTSQAPVAEASVSNVTSLGKDAETLTCINKPYIQYSFTPVLSEDLTHTCWTTFIYALFLVFMELINVQLHLLNFTLDVVTSGRT